MPVSFKRATHKRMHVNMIPLINVIFLMLVFFIITGTYQDDAPDEVDVPIAKSGKDIGEQPLRLILTTDGLAMLNDIPITPKKIYSEISSLLKENKTLNPQNIIITADAQLPAKDLLHVIADVKRAGIQEVSLVTKGL